MTKEVPNVQMMKGRTRKDYFLSFGFSPFVQDSSFVLRHFFMASNLPDELVNVRFHSKR